MPDAQARDIVERLEGRDVLGNPTAPGAWFAAARAETRHWRIPGLSEADDPHYGYPLIDALSNPGKNATVKEGIERAEELADDVTLAIWNVAKSEIDRLTKELEEAREAMRAMERYCRVKFGPPAENPADIERARAALSRAIKGGDDDEG